MSKLAPILDYDLSEEKNPEPYTEEVGNRLEYIQRKRIRLLKAMEEKHTFDDIASDEGLSITYTSTLRDFEKQELAKHKSKKEEELGDSNAAAAVFAADVINAIRQARREGQIQTEKRPEASVPKVEHQLDDVEPDTLAMSDRQFKEMDYDSFRKDLINKGIDKFHKIDENGKIVPIAPPEDEK